MHIQKWFQLRNFFDDDKVDQIIQLTKKAQMNRGGVIIDSKSVIRRLGRNCMSGWIHKTDDNVWVFAEILKAVEEVNKRTLKFDLEGCSIEPLQYLEYGPFQFYNEHVDNGADQVSTRKYSVSLQLSDSKDYWGGNLQIKGDGQSPYAPRERGSMAIFPSHLQHQARPVWLGKRKVIVAWIRGKTPLS